MEAGLLICGANQWTGFYVVAASVMGGYSLCLEVSIPSSFEKFLLVSATQDSVSNHRRAIGLFFLWGSRSAPDSFGIGVAMVYLWLVWVVGQGWVD